MFAIVSLLIINWFFYVLLGIGVGFLIQRLDNQNESLIPTMIASIVGAIAGGFLSNLIFGIQIGLFNFSSFFISLSLALLLGIMTRILRQQTEKEVQENSRSNSYEYAYFSDIKKNNQKKGDFLDQVDFPISKRDLLRHAEQSEASGADLNLLEKLPDHIYASKSEIEEQLKMS